jgi:hypothetical protein
VLDIPNFIGHSSDLENRVVLQTVQGSDLYITIQGGQVYVNSARVMQTDLSYQMACYTPLTGKYSSRLYLTEERFIDPASSLSP